MIARTPALRGLVSRPLEENGNCLSQESGQDQCWVEQPGLDLRQVFPSSGSLLGPGY